MADGKVWSLRILQRSQSLLGLEDGDSWGLVLPLRELLSPAIWPLPVQGVSGRPPSPGPGPSPCARLAHLLQNHSASSRPTCAMYSVCNFLAESVPGSSEQHCWKNLLQTCLWGSRRSDGCVRSAVFGFIKGECHRSRLPPGLLLPPPRGWGRHCRWFWHVYPVFLQRHLRDGRVEARTGPGVGWVKGTPVSHQLSDQLSLFFPPPALLVHPPGIRQHPSGPGRHRGRWRRDHRGQWQVDQRENQGGGGQDDSGSEGEGSRGRSRPEQVKPL